MVQSWWYRVVEQCGETVVMEQWNSVGGTVWWNSGTVEQCWVNSVVEQ